MFFLQNTSPWFTHFSISRSVDFLSDGCKHFAISFPSQLFPAKLPSPKTYCPQFLPNNHHEDPTNGLMDFGILHHFPPQKNRANHAIQRSATSQKHWPLNKSLVDPRPARIHPRVKFGDSSIEKWDIHQKKIENNKEYLGEIMNLLHMIWCFSATKNLDT